MSTLRFQQLINYSLCFHSPAPVPIHGFLLQVSCDSLHSPMGCSNLGGSSLPWDFTSLTHSKNCWFFNAFSFLFFTLVTCKVFRLWTRNPVINFFTANIFWEFVSLLGKHAMFLSWRNTVFYLCQVESLLDISFEDIIRWTNNIHIQ